MFIPFKVRIESTENSILLCKAESNFSFLPDKHGSPAAWPDFRFPFYSAGALSVVLLLILLIVLLLILLSALPLLTALLLILLTVVVIHGSYLPMD